MDQINRVRGELERTLLRNAIVTPSRFIDASTFTGEVYCDGRLVELAMRPNGKAAVKHVSEPASKPTVRLDGNWLYAGLIFEAFGHDLLEISARLWPLLEESYDGVVCHRWRMASNGIQAARNATAGRILEAFGVPFNRVFVVDREVVTVDRLMVPEIAFRINDCAFPIFRSVIEHIGRSVDEEFGTRKIFLSRGRLDGDARRAYEASIVPAAEELG